MNTVKCPKCNYENREDARFCHSCGELLTPPNPGLPDVSQHPTQPLTLPPASDPSTTHPLPEASIGFAPLPEGALLHDGRYVIEEPRTANEQVNAYLVKEDTPVRLCPNCREETSDPQERFCSACGADISNIEPLYLRYLMRESSDEQAFAAESQLLGMRLEHPGLLLPHDVFAEAPYGPLRHYLVEPEFSPPLATSLPLPQKLPRVLKWGVTLAQTLDYLHRHQIALRKTGPDHIAVEGNEARWTQLDQAYVIPPDARSMTASHFAQDVYGLAAALFHLATGERQVKLPKQAKMVFSQALTAPEKVSAAAFAAALEEALQELRRPAGITLVVGRRTDVGQVRSLNEDSLLTLDSMAVFRSLSAPVGLFAVADGMGGHEAGDVASQLAVQAIAQQTVSEVLSPAAGGEELPDAHQWLTDTALVANQAVYSQRRTAGTDMGTTLVMALIIGDQATLANVGDSRAYLLSQGSIVQITTDHSLVERLVATGQITREEAARHPQKNVIYRVIGDKAHTEVDLFDQTLTPGDTLLLCSDGLSGMVTDEQMWQIWNNSTSPQEACDQLVEAANEAGGEDNITVVIVQVAM
ncbi:MAG: Stp1/IreP family PP2C-type Ser/Thr phosphatase [Chloroflexota bacterium]|nr:Stp1/IreP family PP2C-type Ser/Thr phosphatase [Chloroflexota bacterium]